MVLNNSGFFDNKYIKHIKKIIFFFFVYFLYGILKQKVIWLKGQNYERYFSF